jgi:hypothetical protein
MSFWTFLLSGVTLDFKAIKFNMLDVNEQQNKSEEFYARM